MRTVKFGNQKIDDVFVFRLLLFPPEDDFGSEVPFDDLMVFVDDDMSDGGVVKKLSIPILALEETAIEKNGMGNPKR